MAEYRRLISYIYEYEGKEKGKNVGFVKLEARNGMCRLNVNVKKLYMGGGDMGVYLLTGSQEIFLGNIFLRNGCGEFRTMVQVANVEQSGEGMDECYGLTIHEKDDSWRAYTTIWEDAVAQAAQLTLESVTSEGLVEKQVEMGKVDRMPPYAAAEPAPMPDKGLASGRRESAPPSVEEPTRNRTESLPPTPVEEPVRNPRETPPSAPVEEPARSPRETPSPAPVEEPAQRPWEIPSPSPAEEPLERPKETPSSLPAEAPMRSPEGIPSSAHAEETMRILPETAAHEPAEESGREPGKAPAPMPSPAGHSRRETVWQLGTPKASLHGSRKAAEGEKRTGSEGAVPDFEMGQLEMETRNPDVPLLPRGGRLDFGRREESEEKKIQPARGQAEKTAEQKPVIHQYREEPIIIGDPEALAKLDAEDEAERQVPVWDFLESTYPKIQAFDSEHGCQVLVIKPKDIGLLPRETWIYGNNSFLLHGYYNYRYLILARLENPKGRPRYILGVPGHYYSNEKYMASMFGFPHFVLSKKQSTKDGRFGYWYTDVRLEEENLPLSSGDSAPGAAS